MESDKVFRKELLISLGYKEEYSGYSHIKYYTKDTTTFVISENTDRISIWKDGISSEQYVSSANFFKRLKDEYEIQ